MHENFHFIRPLWLLALIPLALLAWRAYRTGGGDNPWSRIVDARLLPLLMVGRAHKANRTALLLASCGWIIALLALADPTWERKPQPVYQTAAARVVVLDLSRSMNDTDLKPSRMVRARYKVEDVLALGAEGQTGLVVYAGDAFTVSPLTRDVNTIRALLKVLDPQIMPAPGSRADLGLLKAGELMRQAGVSSGKVLLIADGVEPDKAAASERAAARLRRDGYRVSVLGIGTENGAPLTDAQGELMRDAAGKIVNPRLDTATLQALARAGGGAYRSLTDGDRALSTLLGERQPSRTETTTQIDATTQRWQEQGPVLAVLLLPLAALAFRRNWLLGLAMLVGLAAPPQPAMASAWDDLWLRADQQAAKALDAGDYAKAADLANDGDRRGVAEYKRGNYQLALDSFARATAADADYNRGNALAKLGRYQDAIAAYDQALKRNHGDEDARANKAAVEAFLRQQTPQHSSNPQRDAPQNGQKENDGGGQNSSQSKAQNQPAQDGGSAQAGASAGQGQQAANATRAGGGPHSAEPPREHGGENPGQDSASAKGSEQQQRAIPDTARRKEQTNQFAEAARKLVAQRLGAKSDNGRSSPGTPAENAADQTPATANARPHPQGGAAHNAQPLDSEEQMAAEQWLRRIPDDPGGLLRRKFLYQYRHRAQHPDAGIL